MSKADPAARGVDHRRIASAYCPDPCWTGKLGPQSCNVTAFTHDTKRGAPAVSNRGIVTIRLSRTATIRGERRVPPLGALNFGLTYPGYAETVPHVAPVL
jgi:hypothetical protein